MKIKSTLVKGTETGKTYEYFANLLQSDTTCQYDGFSFHPGLGYGSMIKTYPYGCQSDKHASWSLFLREEDCCATPTTGQYTGPGRT